MNQFKIIVVTHFFWFAGFVIIPVCSTYAQTATSNSWNSNTLLLPWKMPQPLNKSKRKMVDLDKDDDPDLLYYFINNNIPIVWIDDDDDMKWIDVEGDADSDCLLIDRNMDGIFAGPEDFSIDWCDEDGDGIADIQVIVNNGSANLGNYFDWASEIMYVYR